MAKIIFGNHSSVIVPRQDRDNIRRFYCDVLGATITRGEDERDFVRLGEDFYIAFLYGDVPDESEFLRTARSVWLEVKSDNVEEARRKILESGLVRKLELPTNTQNGTVPCWKRAVRSTVSAPASVLWKIFHTDHNDLRICAECYCHNERRAYSTRNKEL